MISNAAMLHGRNLPVAAGGAIALALVFGRHHTGHIVTRLLRLMLEWPNQQVVLLRSFFIENIYYVHWRKKSTVRRRRGKYRGESEALAVVSSASAVATASNDEETNDFFNFSQNREYLLQDMQRQLKEEEDEYNDTVAVLIEATEQQRNGRAVSEQHHVIPSPNTPLPITDLDNDITTEDVAQYATALGLDPEDAVLLQRCRYEILSIPHHNAPPVDVIDLDSEERNPHWELVRTMHGLQYRRALPQQISALPSSPLTSDSADEPKQIEKEQATDDVYEYQLVPPDAAQVVESIKVAAKEREGLHLVSSPQVSSSGGSGSFFNTVHQQMSNGSMNSNNDHSKGGLYTSTLDPERILNHFLQTNTAQDDVTPPLSSSSAPHQTPRERAKSNAREAVIKAATDSINSTTSSSGGRKAWLTDTLTRLSQSLNRITTPRGAMLAPTYTAPPRAAVPQTPTSTSTFEGSPPASPNVETPKKEETGVDRFSHTLAPADFSRLEVTPLPRAPPGRTVRGQVIPQLFTPSPSSAKPKAEHYRGESGDPLHPGDMTAVDFSLSPKTRSTTRCTQVRSEDSMDDAQKVTTPPKETVGDSGPPEYPASPRTDERPSRPIVVAPLSNRLSYYVPSSKTVTPRDHNEAEEQPPRNEMKPPADNFLSPSPPPSSPSIRNITPNVSSIQGSNEATELSECRQSTGGSHMAVEDEEVASPKDLVSSVPPQTSTKADKKNLYLSL